MFDGQLLQLSAGDIRFINQELLQMDDLNITSKIYNRRLTNYRLRKVFCKIVLLSGNAKPSVQTTKFNGITESQKTQ